MLAVAVALSVVPPFFVSLNKRNKREKANKLLGSRPDFGSL